MTRYLVLLALVLAFAPSALADGFIPAAQQNGDGVLSLDGKSRFVAIGMYGADTTMLARVDVHTGSVLAAVPLLGTWGVPIYTYTPNSGQGLSPDGKTLVLADLANVYPRTVSKFMFVNPQNLHMRDAFVLKGDFEFDALSPSGKRLYLIQHTNAADQSRYVVRAYDVATRTLLPGRVADRTQRSWVMQGSAVARTTSADGRWVYTLYANPNGFPFVHALDTVRGVAHCVGLPWRGSYGAVYNMRLTLHGGSLAVHWLSGRPWLRMNTTSWRLSPDHRGGFGWRWIAALAALAVLAATILAAYGRRTRALAAGTARGDRGSARLGPWLPLTRLR
jgi:hypothetical protein